MGVFSSTRVNAPVIVVGNISVGGNGKTPLVVFLCHWLKQNGFRPGVISRGYGGTGVSYPKTVDTDSKPEHVGDEAVMMKQHIGCPLVVDPKRARGAAFLIEQHQCDVVLCDDGLQHYALHRDIEIVVIDGQRRFGNGFLLPAGPLRESQKRLSSVDFKVTNGGKAKVDEYLMSLEPGQLVNVKYSQQTKPVAGLNRSVVAAAAIGNPKRFFDLLTTKNVKIKDTLIFNDHHLFAESDLPKETVIMTEKDAVKCRDFAHDDWWYLPVSAKLTEHFKKALLTKLVALKSKR
jgi:tetraacyldisaccharide 4'-kinase